MENDPLKSAFAALRAETHGRSEHADATLERVLASAEARKVRRVPRAARWIPLAAALAASSAWAALGNDGVKRVVAQLTELEVPAVRSNVQRGSASPHASQEAAALEPQQTRAEEDEDTANGFAAPSAAVPPSGELEGAGDARIGAERAAAEGAPAASSVARGPERGAAVEPTRTASPARPARETRGAARAQAASTHEQIGSNEQNEAKVGVAVEPPADRLAEDTRDFKAAYRVYDANDPAASVRAWDAYLSAHPSGRFVPEARYARAISLLRAGRSREARAALEPFASAPVGSYRQADAARRLRALP